MRRISKLYGPLDLEIYRLPGPASTFLAIYVVLEKTVYGTGTLHDMTQTQQ